jgi:hypothetical protein
MRSSTRQLVLASALLAAWQLPGGGSRALADYLSAPCLSLGKDAPSPPFGSGSWEHKGDDGAGSSAGRNENHSPDGSEPERTPGSSVFARLFPNAWQVGSGGSTGASSGPSSHSGPPNQYVSGVARIDSPRVEAGALLPPQRDDQPPSSLSSFLFRPPRTTA